MFLCITLKVIGILYNIRSGRAGGGVSLFIKSYIPFSERHDLNLLNEISETVSIQINKNVFGTPKDIIIGIIYRPPNTDPVAFNESFQEILTKIDRENRICYLLGDFDLDLFKADHHGPTSDFLNSLFPIHIGRLSQDRPE